MRLRGPDDCGFIASGGIYFGHRRLAILDPESGQQPWVDPESGVVLVFNGELFNFWELRKSVEAEGIHLRTKCDTELLMAAYRVWGRACLDYLNGMFAFALYDPVDGTSWLVRDRMGVKPLYYQDDGASLRFASSMKGLFAFTAIDRRLDMAAAAHYLRTIRTTLGRRTLIDGVCSLEPGESLLWHPQRAGATEPVRYWDLFCCSNAAAAGVPSFEEAVNETRQRVDAAVTRQMISDVPLGGFLSGGIDSSILSSVASGVSGSRLGTFSVGYAKKDYNEWDAIRENVRYHALSNEEIHLKLEDYRDDWNWLIAEKGLPLSTPNEVPIYRLAQAFGSRYKVALSGEGADEVFGGYIIPTFCAFDWERHHAADERMDPNCFQRAYGTAQAGSRQAHFFRVNSWLSRERLHAAFVPELTPPIENDPVDAYYRELFTASAADSPFQSYLKVHARVNLEGLLSRLDSSTMAASVEGRVPFTDHELVAWLFSLPDSYKMGVCDGVAPEDLARRSVYDLDREDLVASKRLLRGAYAEQLPSSILARRKVSFPVPFAEMFAGPWRDLYRSALNEPGGPSGLLRPNERASLSPGDSVVDPMLAWPIVNLFLWQQEFCVGISG